MDIHHLPGRFRRVATLCRTFLQNVVSFLKKHRLVTKTVTACLVGSLAVGYTVFSSGFSMGLRVKYAGNFIATVKSADVFGDAAKIVLKKTDGHINADALDVPVFQPTLTAPNDFDTALAVADAIIENTDEIVEASSISVDGVGEIFTAVEGIEQMLDAARTRFETEGASCTSYFVKTPSIHTGYYLKSDLADQDEVEAFILSLDVKTVCVSQTYETVPFATETVKTSSQYVGYSKVTTQGVCGLSCKVETVEYQNGKETGRTVETQQTKAPVTEIVTVGTAVPQTTAQQRVVISQAGFSFPLGNASYKVSSYFGDGRNHKGIDLCAKAGTPIYAVADGKVISSKYDGNYGNCVVVDHGNGITTRYAHASVLSVTVGTVVKQGDLLALVGTTGQSYGNHLHFEVAINGTRVNPAPYIGL